MQHDIPIEHGGMVTRERTLDRENLGSNPGLLPRTFGNFVSVSVTLRCSSSHTCTNEYTATYIGDHCV